MDKYSTQNARRGIALALTAMTVAACETGGDFDPREMAMEFGQRHHDMSPKMPEPAVGSIVSQASMTPARPAPAGETAPDRTARADVDKQMVAVGRNASGSVDDRMQRMFASQRENTRTEYVVCSDREVIELLMVGRAEFGLIGGSLSSREIHNGLRQTQIGVELFALSVSPNSPVRSLTRSQVRDIFTGKVTNWQQLGFASGAIVPIVPSVQMMNERAARTLIPGDAFASTCIKARDERHVVDQIMQHKGAIGIVRVSSNPPEAGQRLIQIDWTPPTPDAYGYGTYPFGIPLQLVTSGQVHAPAREFLDFAQSDTGYELLGRTLTLLH